MSFTPEIAALEARVQNLDVLIQGVIMPLAPTLTRLEAKVTKLEDLTAATVRLQERGTHLDEAVNHIRSSFEAQMNEFKETNRRLHTRLDELVLLHNEGFTHHKGYFNACNEEQAKETRKVDAAFKQYVNRFLGFCAALVLMQGIGGWMIKIAFDNYTKMGDNVSAVTKRVDENEKLSQDLWKTFREHAINHAPPVQSNNTGVPPASNRR